MRGLCLDCRVLCNAVASGGGNESILILGRDWSRSDNAVAFLVYDDFAVFFGKCSDARVWQNVEHRFGGPAKLRAERCHHNRAIDENRVLVHGLDQFVIAPVGIAEIKLVVGWPRLVESGMLVLARGSIFRPSAFFPHASRTARIVFP